MHPPPWDLDLPHVDVTDDSRSSHGLHPAAVSRRLLPLIQPPTQTHERSIHMRAQVGSSSLPCPSPLCCLLSGHFPLAHTGPSCLPLGECRQATILPDSAQRHLGKEGSCFASVRNPQDTCLGKKELVGLCGLRSPKGLQSWTLKRCDQDPSSLCLLPTHTSGLLRENSILRFSAVVTGHPPSSRLPTYS